MKYIRVIQKKGIIRCILFAIVTPFYNISAILVNSIFKNTKPSKDYIIFKSHPDYSDNSKVLYEYMRDNNIGKKYIWFLDKETKKRDYKRIDNKTCFIHDTSWFHRGLTIKALYYLNKSGYIYYTQGCIIGKFKPKHNQLRINLWHGCGYKKAPNQHNGKKWIDNNYFDYVLVPGDVFVETKKDFFGCKEDQILTLGYPRYDLFFKDNIKTQEYIKKIANNNALVLWMPTFRVTNNTEENNNYFPEEKEYIDSDLPLIDSKNDLEELNNICKNKRITLCIKRHPNQKNYKFENIYYSNIIFIDNKTLNLEGIDLYSLLKYTDGLITDYSSVAIDYLLLNKPIAYTLNDFKKYEKTRGFVFDNPLDYMPGNKIYNIKDLKQFIDDIYAGNDSYKKERNELRKKVHKYQKGNYSERIIKYIKTL